MIEPLNAAALCTIVRKSISSDLGLKSPYDGLACLVHACMLSTGFKFIGLGEDQRIEQPFTCENVSTLPNDWNTSSASMYAFRYTHTQSSMEFSIRISRLGNKTLIFGIASGDDKTCSFDIITQDFTSENFYPWKPEENAEALANGYISMSRIKDFSQRFKINVLQKLIPGLNKEGYTEERSNAVQPAESSVSRVPPGGPARDPLAEQPRPGYDPLALPRRPIPRPSDWPPDFDDEYEMSGSSARPFNPLANYGDDDLRPAGIDSMDPLRRRPGGRGGMHPTPEQILFPDAGYGTPTFPSPRMPPPSARYDPVFPGDPRGSGGRGGRDLGRGGFFPPGGAGPPMDSDAYDFMFS